MEKSIRNAAAPHPAAFFALIAHPLRFRLYLLKNLPAACFSGLRIVQADEASCVVSVPFKWFTKNPFRSTYFACLSMAAEMSTGVLAMAHVHQSKPAVSMLVTGMEGRFYKKAKGLTTFRCNDGEAIRNAAALAVSSGEAQRIKTHAVGKSESGETPAEFWIEWSFKALAP